MFIVFHDWHQFMKSSAYLWKPSKDKCVIIDNANEFKQSQNTKALKLHIYVY